ncbi:MAG: hypothetical protein JZU63_10590, partial [Rhodoferax sp.]|nr:hypothetical protein [Rhodoferax sp.]
MKIYILASGLLGEAHRGAAITGNSTMIQRNKISGIPTASFPLRPAARLRTALAGTALGLAGLAFAAPLAVSAVMSLPELGIDAGPR